MKNEEKKAFETLIVAETRKAFAADFDFSQGVELSVTEQKALSGLPADFLDLVMAGKLQVDSEDDFNEADPNIQEIDAANLVLNRATDVDEADADKIAENERKLIERRLKERQDGDEASENS